MALEQVKSLVLSKSCQRVQPHFFDEHRVNFLICLPVGRELFAQLVVLLRDALDLLVVLRLQRVDRLVVD